MNNYIMRKPVYSQHTFKYLWRFCCYVVENFFRDNCLNKAAALTFTSLLALVPLIIVSFKILSAIPSFDNLQDTIQNFIFSNFIASSGEEIQTYVQNFSHQATRLSIIGLVFLVITAVLLMFNIEKALNKIWRVKVGRKGVSAFFRYWAVLTFTPLLVGVGIIISSYVFSLPVLAAGVKHIRLLGIAPSLFTLLGFMVVYLAVPNRRVRVRDAFIGAIVATIFFELAKRGFAVYLRHFPTYQLLYGAFSAVPIFLVWVYLSWVIVLLGAEICHALTLYYQYTYHSKLDGFTQAYRWLGYLWQAQQQGKSLSAEELVRQDDKMYHYEPDIMLEHLLATGLVEQSKDGKYLLAADLQTVTLYDLYQRLPWRLPEKKLNYAKDDLWQENLVSLLLKTHANLKELLGIPLTNFYQESHASKP